MSVLSLLRLGPTSTHTHARARTHTKDTRTRNNHRSLTTIGPLCRHRPSTHTRTQTQPKTQACGRSPPKKIPPRSRPCPADPRTPPRRAHHGHQPTPVPPTQHTPWDGPTPDCDPAPADPRTHAPTAGRASTHDTHPKVGRPPLLTHGTRAAGRPAWRHTT